MYKQMSGCWSFISVFNSTNFTVNQICSHLRPVIHTQRTKLCLYQVMCMHNFHFLYVPAYYDQHNNYCVDYNIIIVKVHA